MLFVLPSTTLDPLQPILSAAVRFVAGLGPRDHVMEQIKKLHWLPIKYHINFKLCLMMRAAVTGQRPRHIRDIVYSLSTLSERNRLRAAASGKFDIPRKITVFGERAFFVVGQLFHKTLQTSQTEKLVKEL